MLFKDIRPMLWTEQLDETILFYSEKSGFTCGEKNDEWGWAAMHRDSVEIMLAKQNEHIPFTKPKFTGSFYINIDDVEMLWQKLKYEVNIVYPLESFEWEMREFAIYDNNGYILQFGQPINNE